VLGIGLVLGLAMVLELAHFTFCHTSSPQNPASPHARILPIAVSERIVSTAATSRVNETFVTYVYIALY